MTVCRMLSEVAVFHHFEVTFPSFLDCFTDEPLTVSCLLLTVKLLLGFAHTDPMQKSFKISKLTGSIVGVLWHVKFFFYSNVTIM